MGDKKTEEDHDNDTMPVPDRGKSPRSKRPMTPNRDVEDERGRGKGPTSPSDD